MWRTDIEAARFKPVSGGYLYEAANPWIFAPGRRYIVSEAQRSELLAIAASGHPALSMPWSTIAVSAWIAIVVAVVWALSGHDQPTVPDYLIMGAIACGPLYAVCVVVLHRSQRRVQPVLANAVPTQARLEAGERRRAVLESFPMSWLAVAVVVFSLGAVSELVRPKFGPQWWLLDLVFAGLSMAIALCALAALIRKLRARQPNS
jgi:hypothetical protein